MVKRSLLWGSLGLMLIFAATANAKQFGSLRGMIYDKDFGAPLSEATVLIAETGEKTITTEEGHFLFEQVPEGNFTLVFSKEGYARQVKAEVVVSPQHMTEVEISLYGDFTEMEEFVVQDLEIGGGSEGALLNLRMESPALLDSIGADLISKAGVGDAASALSLVAGATIQEGKFAVVRGLPDRYVNSQMNGVRLPTADTDKRAVQLDQFPSAVIESIQVSKTFTPDQQGDASGGAVNVVLKGIPEERIVSLGVGTKYKTQSTGRDDFLTYKGGGVDFWARDKRSIPPEGGSWDGAAGVDRQDDTADFDFSLAVGGKHEFDNGLKVGGFSNFYYKQSSSYYEDGIDDAYWVENPGDPMTPQTTQGVPTGNIPENGDFKTKLYDVAQGSDEVQWGWLGTVGLETENHSLTLVKMYTRVAEEVATLAEDTRGKEFYFPGYDPDDPKCDGNQNQDAAPYLRSETLEYTERTTETLQLSGKHRLPIPEFGHERVLKILPPELDWTRAISRATLYQPDKRQFGSLWLSGKYFPGFPLWGLDPWTTEPVHRIFKPASDFTLGNVQHIWKDIQERSEQHFVNLKVPFKQYTGDEGFVKYGVFKDRVLRKYHQESFSNFDDNSAKYEGQGWEELWSQVFPFEDHPIAGAEIDVDYEGFQEITAWYWMVEFPICKYLSLMKGIRHERTRLAITNFPESDVTWIYPGSSGETKLNPGDADFRFQQDDQLPAVGFKLTPTEKLTFRGSYTETVARQTFKELTPIKQQEYLGGDVFIGNKDLKMSAVKNYDLRLDYKPYQGGLISLSKFRKHVDDPIEYVQNESIGFTYTFPVNYPKGSLRGYEFEIRQDVGHFFSPLQGLSFGANATIIDSEVWLPEEEQAVLDDPPNIEAKMETRHMMNAPEHLYNFNLTYDWERFNTQFALFYNIRGDTLIAGAGQSNGNFVPNIYETEYVTLNLSVSKKFGDHLKWKFVAKNLTNPDIQTVYRSEYIDKDVVKTSYQKGMEFSLSLTAEF
ncbi:MAG: TonB-dependent receptor [Planctomycetes bacterium]|nr:TonB-dependent receptor [Planctomycetota bacterium]